MTTKGDGSVSNPCTCSCHAFPSAYPTQKGRPCQKCGHVHSDGDYESDGWVVRPNGTVTVTIGDRIREARIATNHSHSSLGLKCGIDHSMISYLESGSRALLRDTAHKLAEGLFTNTEQRSAFLMSVGFVPDWFMSDPNTMVLFTRTAIAVASGGKNSVLDLLIALRSSYE